GGLQALYLTGGSSRIPYVHRRLAELGPIATLDDPKTVVAKGAAGFVSGGRATDPILLRDTEILARGAGRPQPVPPVGVRGPVPASPRSAAPKKSRKPLAVAGAAVAAVLVAAGAVFFVTRPDTAPAAATASARALAVVDGTEPLDSSAPAATADSTFISESTDDVTALLPSKLVMSSSTCAKSGTSENDALQVRCLINVNSGLGKAIGMEPSDYLGVTAWRDDKYARSHLIELRDNMTDDSTTITSPEGNRVVRYTTNGSVTSFELVDTSRGLLVEFPSRTVDQGTALLKELGYTA
ncbi:MAG: Hsp70 family protein, partial [Rhodococcus sp. (in: high G+C Gram-positive bacteria)]